MKTTIRTLVIAAPLATASLMMVPAAAMASDPGPVIVIAPNDGDPQPKPIDKAPVPQPEQPKGPEDKAPVPQPEQPDVPEDKAPAPKPHEPKEPKGPDGLTNPEPCPTHGVDCTPDDEPSDDKGDQPESDPDPVDKPKDANRAVPVDAVDAVAVPTRIDAGLAADEQDGGMELTWLLAGGAVVSASGAAFAARKWARRT